LAFAFFELLILAALSPSIRKAMVRSLRLRTPADCATAVVPFEVTLAALRRSDVWQRWSPHLESASVRERWRSGCWRFVSFDARHQGQPAVAVFAVRVAFKDPAIRIAVVDEESDVVLASEGDLGGATVLPLAAAS
jgi:hypothetical protein